MFDDCFAAAPPLVQANSSDWDVSSYMETLSGATLQGPARFEDSHRASVQALFVTDPADDLQMVANKKDKLLETTDSWMLKDATYIKWAEKDHSRALWLHGDPGKGKTMLAIALIESLTKKIERDAERSRSALLYFFLRQSG